MRPTYLQDPSFSKAFALKVPALQTFRRLLFLSLMVILNVLQPRARILRNHPNHPNHPSAQFSVFLHVFQKPQQVR